MISLFFEGSSQHMHAVLAQLIGDPAFPLLAVLPARAVTMPCPASAFCSCIRGSVFCTAHVSHLHVLMRLIARVSSWRCYPRTLSFRPLKTVTWRSHPRSPSQPSPSPPWPCISSRSCRLAQSSVRMMFQFPGCSCSLRQASA